MSAATQRVVALVDMDCFYCQVETRLNPELKGKPVAVVQYNQWKGGGIIAVNYEARDRGVTRYMRGDEAKEKCSDIVLVSVPTIRGKADLSNYREAGDEVAKVFSEFSDCVQRASIDEAYLDLTKAVEEYTKKDINLKPEDLPSTFVLGYCDSKSKSEDERKKGLTEWLKQVNEQKMIESVESPEYKLALGGLIVEKMRLEILNKTGFHCSAGIAHNKMLAKLTAGLHKPKKQTILPQESIPELYESLPIYKIRNLGGKLGKIVSKKLSISFMSELYKFSLQELIQKFDEKTGSWLYNIARGIDLDPVTSRLRPESIGCCKNFTGNSMLIKRSEVKHWLNELATEISERLNKDMEKNKRRAKLLTVSFCQENALTRCGALNSYNTSRIASDALELIKKFNTAPPNVDVWSPPIKFLGLSVSKFTEELSSIEKYLKNRISTGTTQKSEAMTSSSRSESMSHKAESKESRKFLDKNLKFEKDSEDFIKQCGNVEAVQEEKTNSFILSDPEKSHKSETKDSKNSLDRYFKLKDDSGPGSNKNTPSFFMEFITKNRDFNVEAEECDKDKTERGSKEEKEVIFTNSYPEGKEFQTESVENLSDDQEIQYLEVEKSNISPKKNESKRELDTNENNDAQIDVVKEKCSECGKSIPLVEFLEHIDFHAALKLHSEINKMESSASGVTRNKTTNKAPENQIKRRKRGDKTPSKKMRSIESFFNSFAKS